MQVGDDLKSFGWGTETGIPFSALDGHIDSIFGQATWAKYAPARQSTATGRAVYVLHNGDHRPILAVEILQSGQGHSRLTFEFLPFPEDLPSGGCQLRDWRAEQSKVQRAFVGWLRMQLGRLYPDDFKIDTAAIPAEAAGQAEGNGSRAISGKFGDTSPRGGRPRDKINEWAYNEVNVNGKPKAEVEREWRARKGKDVIKDLADAHDSFEKAIKPQSGSRQKMR